MAEVDVAIIGAGTAGLTAAREVKKVTERYVLIDPGPFGTTCARVGCMPSKVLLQAADDFYRREVFAELGIRGGEGLSVDGEAVFQRVRRLRDYFVSFVLQSVQNYRVAGKLVEQRAEIRDDGSLRLADGTNLRARVLVVAVGSRPIVPESWAPFADRVLTSDTIFEIPQAPRSLAVIGTGVIGMELGQAMHRLGSTVALFSRSAFLAGLRDPQVNQAAALHFKKELDLVLGSDVQITRDGDLLKVRAGDREFRAERVLAAIGRKSNLDGLRLDRLGALAICPESTQFGDRPIFVAGDAVGERPVLHEAADEGHIAGFNAAQCLKGKKLSCFQRRTRLGIVFSEPNVAFIGERLDKLTDPIVGEVSFADQGRSTIMARNAGLLRIYADRHTGCLRGAELVGPAGEHIAHLLAWAIQMKLTAVETLRMPFYHPVVEEGLRTALRDVARQLPDPSAAEIAFCEEESGVESLS